MTPVVDIRGLNKSYAGHVPVHVLHDVNLSVGASEMVALVGPSGAGKTTLLNIISTLDEPTSGQVLITGTDVHRLGQRALNRFRNHRLGFIFQDDLLLGHLTALENVCLPARIARQRPSAARRRAEELLDRVGLADRMKHLPGELSGGQRQRVGIARALVNAPALLLADEPTARLDQAAGQDIVQLLVALNRQMDVVILMVTHERAVAEQAKRIIEMVDGRILSDRRRDEASDSTTTS